MYWIVGIWIKKKNNSNLFLTLELLDDVYEQNYRMNLTTL